MVLGDGGMVSFKGLDLRKEREKKRIFIDGHQLEIKELMYVTKLYICIYYTLPTMQIRIIYMLCFYPSHLRERKEEEEEEEK